MTLFMLFIHVELSNYCKGDIFCMRNHTVMVIAQGCTPFHYYVLISYSALTTWNHIFSQISSFLLVAKWPNMLGAIWTQETSLQARVMAAFLKLGNWPPHESVERCLLCFHCSIRLCMNFFHLLAYWARSSLNANVFIMAMESGLPWGHPWCSTGCLGKTGIRKLPQSQAVATNRAEWLQSPL